MISIKPILRDLCTTAARNFRENPSSKLVKRSRFEVTDVELEAPKTHHGIAAEVYLRENFGVEDDEILFPPCGITPLAGAEWVCSIK